MPLYEYECESCQERFEQIRKFSDPPLDVCPKCGKGPVRKLFSSPAIQFKGSGWYITDYARKASKDGSKSGDTGSTSSTSPSTTSNTTSETPASTSKPADTSAKKD